MAHTTDKVRRRCEEYVTIEIDLDEHAATLLTELAEITGFTIDKLVEYALASQIIAEALRERRMTGMKLTEDSDEAARSSEPAE